MSKFKVGDKVRVIPAKKSGNRYEALYHMDGVSGISCIITEKMEEFLGKVVTIDGNRNFRYTIKEDNGEYNWTDEMFVGIATEPREFIVIRRDDREVIASHKRGDEIVKTAKATCAPSDEFNFETGAKLAFDRLMGREEPKKKMGDKWWRGENPLPQPAPRFKVGDRVVTSIGAGTVVEVDPEIKEGKPYHIRYDNGFILWKNSNEAKPAPKPKYYTGRVVCISGEYGIGKIYTVVNGRFTDKTMNIALPYKSVEHMNDTFLFGKVAEVKE